MSELNGDLVGIIVGCSVGGVLVILICVVTLYVCCHKKEVEDRAFNDLMKSYQQGVYSTPPPGTTMVNSHGMYYNSQQPLWKRSVRRLKSVMQYGGEPQKSQYAPRVHSYMAPPETETNDRLSQFYNQTKSSGSSIKQLASSDPSSLPQTSSIPRPKIKTNTTQQQADNVVSNGELHYSITDSYRESTLNRESLHKKKEGRERRSYLERCYSKLKDTGMVHEKRPLYACHPSDFHVLEDLFHVVGESKDGDLIVRPAPGVPSRPPPKQSSAKRKSKQVPVNLSAAAPRVEDADRLLEWRPIQRTTSNRDVKPSKSRGGQGHRKGNAHPAPAPPSKAAPPSFYFSGPDLSTLARPQTRAAAPQPLNASIIKLPVNSGLQHEQLSLQRPSPRASAPKLGTPAVGPPSGATAISVLPRVQTVNQPSAPARTGSHFEKQGAPARKAASAQARKPPVEELKKKKASSPKGKRRSGKKGPAPSPRPKPSAGMIAGGGGTAKMVVGGVSGHTIDVDAIVGGGGERLGVTNPAYNSDMEMDSNSPLPKERERTGSVSTLKSVGQTVTAQFSFLDDYEAADNDRDEHL